MRLASVLIVFFALLGSGVRAGETRRPNVIIILADDLGWTDVGWRARA